MLMVIPRKLTISFDQGDLGVLKAQVDLYKSISLRVEIPKNNQVQNVKYVHDYREVP
jgi:hypothetical protein